ncbi:hypothetical protein JAAARDRAFT_603655 [Jaapia argillacea MUCL 33604]|uniref:N-acetyltransferase domain-containing protein n=1 Tax=Jaapia argillacea MUCL 33604 TaxID=933084 RepID=A0A067Q2H9_9AGAM|nr:hypothetical protein JAAARDRAFT_603655 [Jaapia argillacea MUCL 33604]
MIYVEEIVIKEEWRCRGVGTWALSRLLFLDDFKQGKTLVMWPTVLHNLEPARNPFAPFTPQETAAFEDKKVGFRRLGNSDFFCHSKNPSHPSCAIPVDGDAPFRKPPRPQTEEEKQRWMLANS